MEVFCRPAVEAAFVRQQIVELLERHLKAGHVESVGSRCLHLLVMFVLHDRSKAVDPPRRNERGRQVSAYQADGALCCSEQRAAQFGED